MPSTGEDSIGEPDAGPVVQAIFIAPGSRLPMKSVDTVLAETGKGLVGDRYHGTRHRHVSVQSATALDAAAVRVLSGGTIEIGAAVDLGGSSER